MCGSLTAAYTIVHLHLDTYELYILQCQLYIWMKCIFHFDFSTVKSGSVSKTHGKMYFTRSVPAFSEFYHIMHVLCVTTWTYANHVVVLKSALFVHSIIHWLGEPYFSFFDKLS